MAESKGLTPHQRRGIAALLTETTIESAAKAAGVHRATLHRWLGDATFCAELRQAESVMLEGVTRQLARLAEKAIGVLDEAMDSKDAPAQRLRAADIALSRHATWRELIAQEARIAEIERALKTTEGGQNAQR